MGGSDQWGNITAGIDLIRRLRAEQAHGLVFPLVTSSSGVKFGKTEAGTVWLDAELTSPYRFYQFWLNTEDADVVDYLKFFTWLPKAEIEALAQAVAEEPHRRAAQRTLAREVTQMVHGETALARAETASEVLFGGDVSDLSAAEIRDIFEDVPSSEVPRTAFDGEGLGVLDLLDQTNVTQSKGEARRLIRSGGVYLNSARVEDENRHVTLADAIEGQVLVLRKGRKKYHLAVVV